MRGRRQEEAEADGLHSHGTAALALAVAPGTDGRQSGRERVHGLYQRGPAEAADVECHERKLVREVAPPLGDRAGADRPAQAEPLEDPEEELVGKRADPVLASGDVELERRQLHGRDWGPG